MYYGWRVVGVTFITLFISVGFIFYSYGVFFPALEEEFGSSRFMTSLGMTFMSIMIAVLAPFLGRAVDSMSIRRIMMTGGILMMMGFFLAAQITALWQFILLLGTLLGMGAALIGQLPSSTLVSNWFVHRRGMALGIATIGVSLSGVFMPHIATYLIDHIGWRFTFITYGVIAGAIIIPLVWSSVHNNPEDIGLNPDGDAEPAPTGPPPADGKQHAMGLRKLTTWDILSARDFWGMTLSFGMCYCSMGAILIHTVNMTMDHGHDAHDGATVLSLSAGVGVIGKFLFGYISDHIDTRLGFWTCMAFQATGVAALWLTTSYTGFVIAGAIFGFGMGGVVPLQASMTGEVFGRKNYGKASGLMSPCMLPIQMGGVPFAGYVYDHTGSYDIALKTFLLIYAAAAVSLLLLRRQDVARVAKHELGIEEV